MRACPSARPFTRTYERHAHLGQLSVASRGRCTKSSCRAPLHQDRYAEGFGTLFTADYDPLTQSLSLHWRDDRWDQSLAAFEEGQRVVDYARGTAGASLPAQPQRPEVNWGQAAHIDWQALAADYARGCGRDISCYLPH